MTLNRTTSRPRVSPTGNTLSNAWKPWWVQARAERNAARILAEHQYWTQSCYFARQSIEIALKTVGRRGGTLAHLSNTTLAGLEDFTVAQLKDTVDSQLNEHSLSALVGQFRPWIRVRFNPVLSLYVRLDCEKWQETTRYPEEKVDGRWQPIRAFTQIDATETMTLADETFAIVEELLSVTTGAED